MARDLDGRRSATDFVLSIRIVGYLDLCPVGVTRRGSGGAARLSSPKSSPYPLVFLKFLLIKSNLLKRDAGCTLFKMNKYDQMLMQYETPFPDEFDMDQVKSRVRKLAPQFDQYPGLRFKLYGVNEAKHAAVNEYTSIYLWTTPDPMRGLLAGDLFDNYAQAFARPSVRSWLIHDIFGNPLSLVDARYSLRRIVPVPRQTKVGAFLESWTRREYRSDALVQIIGLDPLDWQLDEFTGWRDRPKSVDLGHTYSLVNVSLPESERER